MPQSLPYPFGGDVPASRPDYIAAMRRAPEALTDTIWSPIGYDYVGHGGGAYPGLIGSVVSHGAIIQPFGMYNKGYGGDLPLSQLPTVVAPDPWDDPTSNGT